MKNHLITSLRVISCFFLVFFLYGMDARAQKVNNLTGNMSCTAIADDGRHLWVATEKGVLRINKKSKSSKVYSTLNSGLPVNWVNSITKDSSGIKWMGSQMGLISFNDVEWNLFTSENSGLPDNSVLSVDCDPSGKLWLITASDHLASFNGREWWSDDLKAKNVTSLHLLAAASSGIYIATYGHNLYHYSGGTIEQIAIDLADNTEIRKLKVSPDGCLWIGTSSGLFKYMDNKATLFQGPGALPDDIINDIDFSTPGITWILSSTGLIKYKDDQWQSFSQFMDVPADTKFLDFQAGENNIHYIATSSGVLCLKDSTGRPKNSVYASLGGFDHSSFKVEYDRLIPAEEWLLLSYGIGIGKEREWHSGGWDAPSYAGAGYGIVPVHAGVLLGTNSIFAEFGLQASFLSGNNDPNYRLQRYLGLRIQPRIFNRTLWRIYYAGHLKGETNSEITVSFGFAF